MKVGSKQAEVWYLVIRGRRDKLDGGVWFIR